MSAVQPTLDLEYEAPAPPVDYQLADELHTAALEARYGWIEPEPGWQLQGRCAEVPLAQSDAMFFPYDGLPVPEDARDLCAECPVRLPCLATALIHGELDGFWGGVDMRQVNGRIGSRRRRKSGRDEVEA